MLFTYLGTYAQGVWVSQSTGFQTQSTTVTNFSIVDTSVVWISGGDGTGTGFPHHDYSITLDGGKHWVPSEVPTSLIWGWAMIAASSPTHAWATFYNTAINPKGQGQIWHTVDGGANWIQQGAGVLFSTPDESFPNVIHFWNDTDGVVIGDPIFGDYEIYTTTDGGATWDAVPSGDIPDPDVIGVDSETGYTTHIQVVGDTVWFDTNHGRVYRSVDRGYHWTVAPTNLVIPIPGTIDISFNNGSNGIARYFNVSNNTSDVVETSDGGITWSSTFTPVGAMFGADVQSVPGTSKMLVSTGSSQSFSGSSYSLDGGHNWSTIETGTQRVALGIADSLTMWCGGFTFSPTANGVFKFINISPVACNDVNINPGTPTSDVPTICGGDTVTFSTSGVFAPNNGAFSGISWVISSADISGALNPLIDPSFLTSYLVTFPAPETDIRQYVNDGSVIDGVNNPYGIYYWTPVVYGNATLLNNPVQFLQDLTLDANCTYTGTSIPILVDDPNNLNCEISVSEIKANQLTVSSFIKDRNTLDVRINSASFGKLSIQITDITGRLVVNQNSYVSKGSNHESINVENLASGTYILKANVNSNNATTKVVKY